MNTTVIDDLEVDELFSFLKEFSAESQHICLSSDLMKLCVPAEEPKPAPSTLEVVNG